MIRLTASALDRVHACPASACLPQARSTGEAAETGTAVHAFIEATRARATSMMIMDPQLTYEDALDQARTEKLADIAEDAKHQPLCRDFDFGLIPLGAQLEVAFAWDPRRDDGRTIGSNIERDYDRAAPHELVGTADLVGYIEKGNCVVVADWKSGRKIHAAAKSWQLRFLALAAARQQDATSAKVAMVYLRDDRPYIDRAEFDALDLATFAAELRGLVARVAATQRDVDAGKTPNVQLGPACRFCPAMPSCPAHAQLITSIVKRSVDEAAITPEQMTAKIMALSPEAVGEAWVKMERAKAYLRMVDEAISLYARQRGAEGVPLPNGQQVLREVLSTRRRMDGEIAAALLQEKYPEWAKRAVKMEPAVSRASIDAAVQAHNPKLRGRSKLVDGIVAEIAARNGYPSTTSAPVRVVMLEGEAVPEPATPAERAFENQRRSA